MWGCSWYGFCKRRFYAPLQAQGIPMLVSNHHFDEPSGQEDGVSFSAACCIAINIVMGAGFLTLPAAFVSSGLVLGTVVILAAMIILNTAAMYEVEVLCRAEAWVKADMNLLMSCLQQQPEPEKCMEIGKHTFHMSEVCRIFGGRKLQVAYNAVLIAFIFTGLWLMAAVFGNAVATYAPIPFLGSDAVYQVYIVLFALIVIPLSIMNIREQAGFQVFLTFLRLLVTLCMVTSIVMALYSGGEPFGQGTGAFIGTTPAVRWWGVFQLIPAVFFALTLAAAPSTIVSSLQHKNAIGVVIWTVTVCSGVMYTIIALAGAYYFGANVHGSCNINWEHYGQGGKGTGEVAAVLEKLMAHYIILFPAVDGGSIFPLSVAVLANNLMELVYGDNVERAGTDRIIITTFRAGCAIPPLLCALLLRDLSQIVFYAGIVTVLIALIFPTYVNLISKRMCFQRFGTSLTSFTGKISSSTPVLLGILAFGTLFLIGLVVEEVLKL